MVPGTLAAVFESVAVSTALDMDYIEMSALLKAEVIGIADGLTIRLKNSKRAFLEDQKTTADALVKINAAQTHLDEHLEHCAKTKCLECKEAFTELKEQTFQQLQEAISGRAWEDAAHLFCCLESAEKIGLEAERRHVRIRLLEQQKAASKNLVGLVEGLNVALVQDDFMKFEDYGCSIGNATRLLAESVLGKETLKLLTTQYARLLSQVDVKFQQTLSQCRAGLEDPRTTQWPVSLCWRKWPAHQLAPQQAGGA